MHLLPDIILLKWLLWFPVLGIWSNSGGNSTTPTTQTGTSSGATSPVVIGGGGKGESTQGIGSGSIGLSGSSTYLEAGAQNLAGTKLSTGAGGNITIGDPSASNALAQIAQSLANNQQGGTVPGSSGGGGFFSSVLPASGASTNWMPILLLGGVILAIYALLRNR